MNFSFCKCKSEEYDEEGEKKRILLECRDGRKSPLNTSEEEDEKEEKKRKLLESREDENFQPKRRWKELVSKWNWRNLILASVLWVAELFMFSAYSLIAPFFPSAAEAKGCNTFITGLIISAAPFCWVVVSPIVGYFLPVLGAKSTLLSGMLFVSASFLLMGFLVDVPSGFVFITLAVLLRMTEGVGWAMFTTSVFSILAQLFPTHVALMTGLVEVGVGIGLSIGPPIGAVLYTLGGFKVPFITVAGAILFLVPIILVLMKPTSSSSKSLPIRTLLKLLSHSNILVILLSNITTFSLLTYMNPTLAPFLIKEFELSTIQIGLMFSIIPAVYVPASLVMARLSDIFGTRKFIISGYIICSISFFLMGANKFISRPHLWLTISALVLLGLALPGMIIPVYPDVLKQANIFHPNEEKETMTSITSGLATSSMSLGEFLGPLTGGGLVQITDFPTCSMILTGTSIFMCLLILGVTLIHEFQFLKEKCPAINGSSAATTTTNRNTTAD